MIGRCIPVTFLTSLSDILVTKDGTSSLFTQRLMSKTYMRNEGGRNRLSLQNIQHHQSVAIICSLSLGHVLRRLNSLVRNDCAAFEVEIMLLFSFARMPSNLGLTV